MNDTVQCMHHPDGIAEVILNRPDKMNAITPELIASLIATGESLIRHRGLRAVILRGEGRAFCAGLDVANFSEIISGTSEIDVHALLERTHSNANQFQRVATVWRDVPVPVIAALHGAVLGGGLQIALGADIRLTTSDTKFSVMEIKWGLVPDMAGMPFLRELVRSDVARELIYTGRIINGIEAVQLGLATRIEQEPVVAAMQMAKEIAQKSPQAIRAAKRLMNHWSSASDSDLLLAESQEQSQLLGQAEQIEAVLANAQKRPPVFHDPD